MQTFLSGKKYMNKTFLIIVPVLFSSLYIKGSKQVII